MENLKRKRSISVVTIQRYYEALKKIEELTKDEFIDLPLQYFIRSFGVSGNASVVFVSKGILKQKTANGKGRRFCYKWNTIKPSLQMAKACIEEVRRLEDSRRMQRYVKPNLKEQNLFTIQKEKVEKIPVPEVKKEVKEIFDEKPTRKRKETKSEEQKEISLFWGLFKYKSNK